MEVQLLIKKNGSTISKTPSLRSFKRSVKWQGLQYLNRSHAILKNMVVALFPN